MNSQPKIIIYTASSCPHSQEAKYFFKQKKLDFKEFDILKSAEKARKMEELSGQSGTPVIIIDDKVVTGFDQEKLKDYLAKRLV